MLLNFINIAPFIQQAAAPSVDRIQASERQAIQYEDIENEEDEETALADIRPKASRSEGIKESRFLIDYHKLRLFFLPFVENCCIQPHRNFRIGSKPAGASNQPIREGSGDCVQGYSTERLQRGVTKVTHPAPVIRPKTQKQIPMNRLNFSPQLIHQVDSYLPTALLLSKRKAKHTQA